MALQFPDIDPIALRLGPVVIRWYALSYIAGLTGGWRYLLWLARKSHAKISALQIDDFLVWATLGTVIGGRFGCVLFYKPGFYFADPVQILYLWHGGMSFHGGITGVCIAAMVFARIKGKRIADVCDFLAPLPGIGIFAVRIGNFINGQLWGKPTDLPWGFGVPDASGVLVSRHASQLYEASLEGLLSFVLVWWFTAKPRPRLAPTGLFFIVYGCARFTVEWVRLPDANIGYLAGDWLTMGMVLTTPMIFIGAGLLVYAYGRNQTSGNLSVSGA